MNLCLFPVDWKKVFGGRFQMVYLLPELVPGLTQTLKGHYRNNNKAAASFAQKLPGQGHKSLEYSCDLVSKQNM